MEQVIVGAPAPRSVDAGRGVEWWTAAWALFMKKPGMWVVLGLILIIIVIVLAFVPLLGTLATSLLLPVFSGGWMLAARKVAGGGGLEPADLFTGFKDKLVPLLVLGVLLLGATLIITLVVGALGFGGVMAGMAAGSNASGAFAAAGAGMLALLVGLALGLVVGMAIWFASALVVFRDVAPVDALKLSVAGSLKNIVPFLVYGLVYLVAAVIASLLFGLGWVVLVPLSLLTAYVSYQDVFEGAAATP